MSRPTKLNKCERIHIQLYEGDAERIDQFLVGKAVTRSHLIRSIVRSFLDKAEARAQLKAKNVEISDDLIDSIGAGD